MRSLRFFLLFFLSVGFLWFLHYPLRIGDKSIPPLGKFFNPISGFWANAEPVKIDAEESGLKIPGLTAPVSVVYDDLMVPHIFAASTEDALRVQGYIHAQNRLWQMDIGSRQISGRLSEVLGPRTLETDRLIRRRGLPFAAENNLKSWMEDPHTAAQVQAYCDGVNAWIDQLSPADYPIEFKLLQYEPEHWTPLKISLIVESMIDALNSNDNDLAATNSLAIFGRDTFNYLYPSWNTKQVPVIPDTGQWEELRKQLAQSLNATPAATDALSYGDEVPPPALPADYRELSGSNNWAVSGKKSASGFPLLANDTHLPLRLPHVWFQQQLHTPDFNAYGIVVPGVPGIAIGFNDDIAWGFTNVSQEVADWYRIQWADAARTRYILDGQERAAELRIEEIKVKGQETVFDTVRYTVWGPVVHRDPKHPLYDHAYRYSTHDEPEHSFADFEKIVQGKNIQDYRRVLPGLDCLSQNVVFASHTGDIAITVQGRFPLRKPEQGRFIQDGSQSANAWGGYIPDEQLPSMTNPSRGFVFSANQHSTPPSFPYYYLGNFDTYRSREIYRRLSNMPVANLDSMKSIQLDIHGLKPADALPDMLQLLDRSQVADKDRPWLEALEKWNYEYERDNIAPSLFEMWFDSTYTRCWDELDAYRKQKRDVLYPDSWRFIEMLDHDTSSIFFDHPQTPQRETARQIVTEGFQLMAEKARSLPNQELVWKKFKGFSIKHIAQIDAFSHIDVPTDGIRNTPNAIGKGHGPSFRMLVELGRPVKALGVYAGGQSGNPGSIFYDNMLDAWANGRYFELLMLHAPDENPSGRIVKHQNFKPGK